MGIRQNRWLKAALLSAGLAAAFSPQIAQAAEGGVGFYLLGSKATLSGLTPPPGLYFQNDVYYNWGSVNGARSLPLNGNVAAGLRVGTWLEVPTILWSTPIQVLGGNLAFSATLPIGGPTVKAAATLTGPMGGVLNINAQDSIFTVGDPVLGATVGWHSGDFHWNLGVLVNTPIGDYRDGALANISFNHWGEDVAGGFTWLDPKSGWEISGALGVTFNQINNATQYKTGNQLHFDGGIIKHFPNQFALGVVGYYYDQISGDSGSGAVFGPFEGRVAALGGYAGYTFKVQEQPVTASFKLFKEFGAEKRMNNGIAAYFTLSVPLSTKAAAK